MANGLQIGTVAAQAGLTVDAVRFYEKSGLLNRPRRSEGGFRLFRPGDIEDLKFIRKAQDLGFSLQEIRELLLLQANTVGTCEHVRELLNQKMATVRRKIVDLQKLEDGLSTALRKCDRGLKSTTQAERCPVLDEFGRKNEQTRNEP